MENRAESMNIRQSFFLLLLFSLISFPVTLLANDQELIANGSFEQFNITKDKGRTKRVTFDNWTGDGEVWTNDLGKTATDGVYKAELDVGKTVTDSLSQNITTASGQKYRVSLEAYARRAGSSDFEIWVDNSKIASISPDNKWQRYDAYFTGTGSTQILSLKEIDTQNDGRGTVIDNISLKASDELIANGSFEDFTVSQDNGRWKLATLNAWQGASEVWTNKLGKRATLGGHKIELDVGSELNSLSQSVATQNRITYELSLDAYARRAKSSDFEVWVDNEKLETVRPTKAAWQRYTFRFVGSGETQQISIKEVGTQSNGNGAVIDNVSLVSTGQRQNTAPTISGNPANSVNLGENYSFTPNAQDADSDTLSFSISHKPAWASFDTATGKLSGTPTAAGMTSSIVITVSDGDAQADLDAFNIEAIRVVTELEEALQTGNAAIVSNTAEIITAARSEIASLRTGPSYLPALFSDESIQYDPGNRTQLINLKADVSKIWPILLGNKGKTLAAAGTSGQSRFAAFGSVPMEYFLNGTNLSYEPQFKRLLAWLLAGEPVEITTLDSAKTIALSFASGDAKDVKNWIAAQYAHWNLVECNDIASLATCYGTADLIITGWQTDNGNAQAVRQVLDNVVSVGTPVLYLHTWYEAYNDVAHTIADLFGFALPYGGNYWAKDKASWASFAEMQAAIYASLGYEGIDRLLAHFENGDYAFDWSVCNGGKWSASCSEVSGFSAEFRDPANQVRSMLTSLDQNNFDLFAREGYQLQKLLILLGDKYRQAARFPMDKNSTDDNTFLKSLYADYSVYNSRATNPAQSDMGNFSRSDFSHITPTNKTVNLESKKHFRAAGVYALPGQTVRVTRHDNSAVVTKIFVNTLRSQSTHEFENNGYKRPKFLKSVAMEVKSGETISLTSPYGGPIQVAFDTNDLPVSFSFQNVGEHPFWDGEEDNATFEQQLTAGDYDWAELVTPGFQVHSTLEKMRQSMNDTKSGNAKALADATMRYMHNLPHVLAGFQGPSIDVVPELHSFATTNGWEIETIDLVKHMNADQASCGYGCSGNPYDAYWAFSPIGHGDVHELGHGLQGGKRFAGWENHTMTNYYSYYTKSHYHKDTGGDPSCQALPFEMMFNVLQASTKEADPAAYVKANLWDKMGWSHGAGMFIQMMMSAQANGALQDGWLLRARLHMFEREYERAKKDETTWQQKRDNLGFGQYTWAEIKDINTNDWYLVAISYVTGMDHRDYFSMWALPYGAKAAAQVAALGYPVVPRQYFVSDSRAYCYGLDKPAVPVDGEQVWSVQARAVSLRQAMNKLGSNQEHHPEKGRCTHPEHQHSSEEK